MKAPKKPAPKVGTLFIGSLSAKILGRSRTAGDAAFSSGELTLAFPAFNALELSHALTELLDKDLLKQTGIAGRATYALTEMGRDRRVSVG